MTWISAIANPPPPWVMVLATDGESVFFAQVTIGVIVKDELIWMDEKKREWFNVTFWQEIPEIPEKKSGN